MKKGDKQEAVAKETFICYVLEVDLSFYTVSFSPTLDALWPQKTPPQGF